MDKLALPEYTGRTLGNWRLGSVLGQGGFGTVYEAEHQLIAGRRAAVKVLHAHLSVHAEMKRRFLNEASAASQAEHENIVQIFDGGVTEDGLCYVVMGLLAGRTLHTVLKDGPLGLERTRRIGAQIAGALVAAHQRGIVHRDLKPENILLVERDHDPEFVKVLDFGIAKLRAAASHTATGAILGTPAYMSPEQWQTLPDIDGRTDIYALGVMLFECHTGKPPFQGSTQYQFLDAHLHKQPPDPAGICPTPEWLSSLILLMLAKAPKDRPQTMAAVREALLRGGADSGPVELVLAPERTRRPWRWLALSGAAGLGLLGFLLHRSIVVPQGSVGAAAPKVPVAAQPLPSAQTPGPAAAGPPGTAPAQAPRSPQAGPPGPAAPEGMVALGPARFRLGGEGRADGPAHLFEVERFALDRYEVHMEEYRRFTTATRLGGPLPWDGVEEFSTIAELPVNQVTQGQAAAYCAFAHSGGRLPTEAEWEFAARDGGARLYPWGDRFEPDRVNAGGPQVPLRRVRDLPAGASSAGVFHLLGNVAEWTAGPARAYPGGVPVPPRTAVVRGGSVENKQRELSATRRRFVAPSDASPFIGFRCAVPLASGSP